MNEQSVVQSQELSDQDLDAVSGGFFSEALASLKLVSESISNVQKSRHDAASDSARNVRG